jgi:hypothetical protein
MSKEKLIEKLNEMNDCRHEVLNQYFEMMNLINRVLKINCTVDWADRLYPANPWAFSSKKYSILWNECEHTYKIETNHHRRDWIKNHL